MGGRPKNGPRRHRCLAESPNGMDVPSADFRVQRHRQVARG